MRYLREIFVLLSEFKKHTAVSIKASVPTSVDEKDGEVLSTLVNTSIGQGNSISNIYVATPAIMP